MLLKPFSSLVLAASCVFLTFPAQSASPDFTAAHAELVELLRGFIRIDTSNPPGNETRACDYLKPFLDREGIPAEVLALEPSRGNLVARLKGNGKKKPCRVVFKAGLFCS